MSSSFVDCFLNVFSQIDELINRRKLPIIVGGTNYYIESILFKILVSDETQSPVVVAPDSRKRPGNPTRHANDGGECLDTHSDSRDLEQGRIPEKRTKLHDDDDDEDGNEDDSEKFRKDMERLSNEELYQRLKEVDPVQSERYHPNDRRKVLR